MAQSDCAAVDVQLVLIEAQSLADCDGLCCECLVGLDQVHISNGQAGLSHDLLGSSDGAKTHDLRLDACQSTCDPGSQRLHAQLLGLLFAHDDQSSCAIVDSGGVCSGDDAVLGEGGLQLCQHFGSAQTGAFIGIEHGIALLALDDNRNDLILESTILDGLVSLQLAVVSEIIQHLAGDGAVAVLLLIGLVGADVLSGHAHVLVEAAGIPQSIVDHGIHDLALAHGSAHAVAVAALHHCEGSHIHVLHAACDHDVSIAGLDHLSSHVDAVQTGAADHVDGDSRSLDGQASLQGSLTSDVLAQTSLDDAAHVNMIDLLGFHVSTVQGLLDNDGAQLCSRDVCQGAAKLTNSGTASRCDNNFLHVNSLLNLSVSGFRKTIYQKARGPFCIIKGIRSSFLPPGAAPLWRGWHSLRWASRTWRCCCRSGQPP